MYKVTITYKTYFIFGEKKRYRKSRLITKNKPYKPELQCCKTDNIYICLEILLFVSPKALLFVISFNSQQASRASWEDIVIRSMMRSRERLSKVMKGRKTKIKVYLVRDLFMEH